MKLQSKILRTRKRLSDEKFVFLQFLSLGLASLLGVCAYSFRLLAFPRHWAITEFDIPLAQDETEIDASDNELVTEDTPTIILTKSSIHFGVLGSIARTSQEGEKFVILQENGIFNKKTITEAFRTWVQKAKPSTPVLIIAPSGDIPITSVIKLSNLVRNEHVFERVILAGGIKH